MTPEELSSFRFDQDNSANVLGEKNLNTTMKQTLKGENFIMSSPSCKLKQRVERSVDRQPSGQSKSKSISKGLVPNESVNFFQIDPNHNHSVQSPSAFCKEERANRLNTIKSEAASR